MRRVRREKKREERREERPGDRKATVIDPLGGGMQIELWGGGDSLVIPFHDSQDSNGSIEQ